MVVFILLLQAGVLWAAAAEKVDSIYQQARQLYTGTSGEQDVARAVVLFEEAAAAGHPEAQIKMGVLHELGIGCRQDISQAFQWYYLAAAQKQPVAQMKLGILLSQNLVGAKVLLGTNLYTCPDYEASAKWLRAAADQDYAPAQMLLGDMVKLFFTKGNTTAQWNQSVHGNSVGWYARAATNGMPRATWKTANAFLEMGYPSHAYLWLYRSQAEGFSEATGLLEKIEPSMGPSTRFEVKKSNAEKWSHPRNPKWFEWSELIFLRNQGEEAIDGAAAKKYEADLRAKAENGNAKAQFNLALNLQYPQAQFSGLVPTSSPVGDMIGSNSVKDIKRLKEAFQWYEKAARQKHHDAQYHLAILFRYGLIGDKDLGQAHQWFLMAAEAGHREAQYELAILLDEGFAGASQPENALRWFQKAAQAGHLGAKKVFEQRTKVSVPAPIIHPATTNKVARVAIIKLNAEFKDEEDYLIAGLSKLNGVEVVERTEIQRIMSEQMLTVPQQLQYLELGQLLRADGLLILEKVSMQGKNLQRASWVAVGPGIVLAQSEIALPLADMPGWSQKLIEQLSALGSKMTLTVRDAVPVSLLNLRSAITSPGSELLERQLTARLKQRLLVQPEIFVLERTHLDQLVREKDITEGSEQKFWGGSYLLEGVMNRSGVSSNRLSIDLQLTSPWQNVKSYSLQGATDQPEKLLDQLAGQVIAELVQGGRHLEWGSLEEARRYYMEARWALRRDLFAEARQAADSAWALGLRDSDLKTLLIQISIHDSRQKTYPFIPGREKERLGCLLKAAELLVQHTNIVSVKLGQATEESPEWLTLAGNLINASLDTLDQYARVLPATDQDDEANLARLREICRESIPPVLKSVDKMEERVAGNFLRWIVFGNALYHENAQSSAEGFRQLILAGTFRRALNLEPQYSPARHMNLSTWGKATQGPKTIYKAYEAVLDELEKDDRLEVREDVLLGRLGLSSSAYDFKYYFQALSRFAWEQRELFAQTDRLKNILEAMRQDLACHQRVQDEADREILKQVADEIPLLEAKLQPWLAQREQRVRDAALEKQANWQREAKERHEKFLATAHENARRAETNRFAQLLEILKNPDRAVPDLLVLTPRNMTEEQAKEIQALLPNYRARVGGDFSLNFLEMTVAKVLKRPAPGIWPQAGVNSPAYLRAIPSQVPDWKSANLPEVDKRFTVPRGNTQSGQFVPSDVMLSQNAMKARQTNYFTVDSFWLPPVRLPEEEQDMRSVIKRVEVWQDTILLEMNRDQYGIGGLCWMKYKIGETQARKITLPRGLKSGIKVLPALVLWRDALVGTVPEGVLRYSLIEDKWDVIPVALPADCRFQEADGQLIAWNKDGIYLIDLSSGAIKIMASSHRQPAENMLDGLANYQVNQVAGLGKDHVVLVVNWKSYAWSKAQHVWSELKTSPLAGQRLISLGDSLLVSSHANTMDGGFMRLDDARQAAKPYIQLQSHEVIFPPTEEGKEESVPRWVCSKLWANDSVLQMVQFNNGFIAVARDLRGQTAVDLVGKFCLFLPGIDRPVELLPQLSAGMVGLLRTTPDYQNTDFSLKKTSNHLVLISHDRRGLWLVPIDRVQSVAAEQGEKLKRLLDEKIAQLPGQERLQRIKAEQNKP